MEHQPQTTANADGFWYCLCLYGVCCSVIDRVQLGLPIMGCPTGALTTMGCLIIFLILLKVG